MPSPRISMVRAYAQHPTIRKRFGQLAGLLGRPSRPCGVRSSLYLPWPVYEVPRKIAFENRVRIRDLVLKGTDAIVAPASLSVARKSWDRETR